MQGKYDRQQIVDMLTAHLGKVESIRNHVLKEYYEEHTVERDDFENMVDQYTNNIKKFMNIQSSAVKEEQWPLVLIGSIVEVQDMDYAEIERLKIVPPFYEEREGNLDCASCLSPVGNALLFKKIGDKITVKTPIGESNLMVKSIELPLF